MVKPVALSPRPIINPSVRLRERSPVQVSTRSPNPANPYIVSASAPEARPSRANSARPRVINAARALAPSATSTLTADLFGRNSGGPIAPGTYQYAVTFTNANGETTIGPILTAPIPAQSTVNIETIPIGPYFWS